MRVPLGLMIGGICLSSVMAISVLLAGVLPKEAAGEAVGKVQVASDQIADNEGEGAESNQAEIDAKGDPESSEDKSARLAERLNSMMWQTLAINGMMFVTFGLCLWIAQLGHDRSTSSEDDVRYPIMWPATNAIETSTDSEDPTATELSPMAFNPYAAPDATDESSEIPPEPWSATVELRFAMETFLVAYLPTTALRLLIVALQPDAPSHPFLEMLEGDVDWSVMTLIALMAVVVAPLVEELLYRVTILGGLWQHKTIPAAWLVSSVLFGFAHGFPDSIALLPLAFAIGYTYIRRRSYRTVVLVHFLFNGFNMVLAGAAMF